MIQISFSHLAQRSICRKNADSKLFWNIRHMLKLVGKSIFLSSRHLVFTLCWIYFFNGVTINIFYIKVKTLVLFSIVWGFRYKCLYSKSVGEKVSSSRCLCIKFYWIKKNQILMHKNNVCFQLCTSKKKIKIHREHNLQSLIINPI